MLLIVRASRFTPDTHYLATREPWGGARTTSCFVNTIAYPNRLDPVEVPNLTPQPRSLEQAELVYAEIEQIAQGQQLEVHAHSCHELVILLRGSLEVQALEKTYAIQPGEAKIARAPISNNSRHWPAPGLPGRGIPPGREV